MRDRNRAMMRLTADVAAARFIRAGGPLAYSTLARNITSTTLHPLSFKTPWGILVALCAALGPSRDDLILAPEGRSPAMIDSWVFVAFENRQGHITQKDITVRSKRDGRILVWARPDGRWWHRKDDATIDALEDPSVASELREQVIFEQEDVEAFGDVIADPTQTFVPTPRAHPVIG